MELFGELRVQEIMIWAFIEDSDELSLKTGVVAKKKNYWNY